MKILKNIVIATIISSSFTFVQSKELIHDENSSRSFTEILIGVMEKVFESVIDTSKKINELQLQYAKLFGEETSVITCSTCSIKTASAPMVFASMLSKLIKNIDDRDFTEKINKMIEECSHALTGNTPEQTRILLARVATDIGHVCTSCKGKEWKTL